VLSLLDHLQRPLAQARHYSQQGSLKEASMSHRRSSMMMIGALAVQLQLRQLQQLGQPPLVAGHRSPYPKTVHLVAIHL
jgi:hypothetical protein